MLKIWKKKEEFQAERKQYEFTFFLKNGDEVKCNGWVSIANNTEYRVTNDMGFTAIDVQQILFFNAKIIES